MVSKNVVYRYLGLLIESVDRIIRMDVNLDMITGDEDIQDLLDRRMEKAIEACISIAAHFVYDLKLGKRETSAGLFEKLAEKKIISKKLALKMGEAVGLRNILVHKYTEFDYRIAYKDLGNDLGVLREFAKRVKGFLESNRV
ncbi:DUF86 domain-containing protein [Patescibacteria group bacterium]|nr:DUF86 domain-containing protein [Patescibacteria group bacterium]MCG2701896.1 DUF86 domain-containing protein [Candidatus Parcubacteria bacterium]